MWINKQNKMVATLYTWAHTTQFAIKKSKYLKESFSNRVERETSIRYDGILSDLWIFSHLSASNYVCLLF